MSNSTINNQTDTISQQVAQLETDFKKKQSRNFQYGYPVGMTLLVGSIALWIIFTGALMMSRVGNLAGFLVGCLVLSIMILCFRMIYKRWDQKSVHSIRQTAQKIFDDLRSDSIIANCLSDGVIDKIVYDDPTNITRPHIKDTSDKSWPVSIQKVWPYYITGVSRMWLNLVAEVADQDLKDQRPASLEDIKQFYQQVNENVTDLWQKKGRHAFLHHLNAVFGYEPLIYWEKRYLDF